MTKLLEKAFAAAATLPKDELDALAQWLLAELASERRWDEAFRDSQRALGTLANEALEEYRSGRTRKLDSDKL